MSVETGRPAGKFRSRDQGAMTPRITSSLLLLLSLNTVQVAAQTRDFNALRDSLTRLSDTATLRRLENARRPGKTAPATAFVEHGLIAQRLYDLTADHAANKLATRAFEAAVARDPQLGWAHFGLGVSLASSPEAKPLSEGGARGRLVLDNVARKLVGMDARSRARRELNAALKAAPPINRAARELAALSLQSWNRESLEEARSALQALVDQGQALPEDFIVLANLQTALGRTQDAMDSADRARAADGSNAAALYAAALARLRTKGREAQGAELYFQCIAAADERMLKVLFDDFAPVADPGERDRWNNASADTRRELLKTFWELRAGLGGITVADRLAEHYARLATAEREYRRNAEYGVPDNPLRQTPAQTWSRFDDRGEIYIRHGEPFRVIRTVASETLNESWVYRLPDGPRMYHFFKYSHHPDYVLPHMLPCNAEFWSDRAVYDAQAGMFGVRCSAMSMMSYSADWRELAFEALETDTHYPRFTREIPFLYDLYTFRGSPGRTAVVAAFAVPAAALKATAEDGRVRYRFDLSLILADTALGTVSRTDDSASIFTPKPLDGDDLLRAHLEVQVPPSPSTLQRVIVTDPTEPGIGQLYLGPFPIPDYSGKQLMLSDIALGQLETPRGGWKRGDVTIALVPTNQFSRGNFALYYEVYNLPSGSHYTTEVVIDRLDKGAGAKLRELFGGGQAVRVRFEGESTANAEGTLPVLLRRFEANLGKGRYRLTVTVKNLATGVSAKSSRNFIIPD